MTTEELKNEFYSLIWKTATNLVHGGKVSPVQFMDYMLGALFYNFNTNDNGLRSTVAERTELDAIIKELEGEG